MRVEVAHRLSDIPGAAWDSLRGADNPFLSHAFLQALEEHGCVEPERGWLPWHLLLYQGDALVAAAPAYLKGHSWGEFVFDWSWAQAHESRGLPYYPKLIAAVPFSPVTGPRILLAGSQDEGEAAQALGEGARRLAQAHSLSSVHWLFPQEPQAQTLARAGYALRYGCQFHWHNRGYRDFQDFIAAFTSKKRKNVRQERAGVTAAGIEFDWLHGGEIDEATWRFFRRVYTDTFDRHHNLPPLGLEFFIDVGRRLRERLVLVLGRQAGEPVAAALCLRSADTLYGRYWGASREIPGLHFEACYYQGIEYCIRHGLTRFEPGAQGEHKVARGFLPTTTYSAHWIRDRELRSAIGAFLHRERAQVAAYAAEVARHSPFRQPD